MFIASIDPSLRNTGIVIGKYTNDNLDIIATTTVSIVPEKDKNLRQSEIDIECIIKLFKEVLSFISQYNIEKVVVELPIGSQSSRGMVSYAVSCCLIAEIQKRYDTVYVTPFEVKDYLPMNKPSKKDIISSVNEMYPNILEKNKQGKPLNKNEHVADAVIILKTGIDKL